MEELKEEPVDKENWSVKFKIMKDRMDHHLKEEEDEIAPKARQVFEKERLKNLAEKFEEEMNKQKKKLVKDYAKK